ncbi:MAG TPA: NTP transferase domain-containing protein [Solirubrobacteraceae bacterium]|jgi:molybdopterin-guanine dinucleotide biosynthesis protein A|nr:NTP transferase domain-containing protein [Solirubrobacteraceae bacterium]
MEDRQAIVAVLAGGLGRRLGGSKPSVALGGQPLLGYPLKLAAQWTPCDREYRLGGRCSIV